MTVSERLGTPAPVLPENDRGPQSVSQVSQVSQKSVGKKSANKRRVVSKKASLQKTVKKSAHESSIKTSQSSITSIAVPEVANVSAASAANVVPVAKKKSVVGADLTTTMTTSTVDTDTSDRSTGMDFEFAPWVQVSKQIKLDAYIAANQDLRGDREFKLANSRLGIANTPVEILGPSLKYRAKLTWALPTNETDRELASFRSSLSLANRFYYELVPDLSGYYQLSLGRGIYRYDTTAAGESNNEWTLANTLLMNYDIKKFYLQLVPRISSTRTFRGTDSTRFELTEEVGLNFDKFAVGIGHTNSDNLYLANGRDSNFSVFDRDTSNYYLTTNITF